MFYEKKCHDNVCKHRSTNSVLTGHGTFFTCSYIYTAVNSENSIV